MNLGVTHEALGNRSRASDYYQQSFRLYESLGDEARAAQIQANRAALLIQSGINAEKGCGICRTRSPCSGRSATGTSKCLRRC